MKLIPRCSPGASVTPLPNGWRLEIPTGGSPAYRFAQLDDYTGLSRKRFPAHPPLTLMMRARASGNSLPGTWGFGLWNDPFGMSIGFGGNPFRLPTLPNTSWFFHASQENWLSFSDRPGNGFLAQVFASPTIPSPLLALSAIPFLPLLVTRKTREWIRNLAQRLINEDGIRLNLDVTLWHEYRLEWSTGRSVFSVDDGIILNSTVSPTPPLGLVIWLDNQFATFTPEGRLGFGVLQNENAWLEIENLELK